MTFFFGYWLLKQRTWEIGWKQSYKSMVPTCTYTAFLIVYPNHEVYYSGTVLLEIGI